MISILTPTRKRPDGIKEYLSALYNNCDNPQNIEHWFYVDNDDIESKTVLDDSKIKYPNINYIFDRKRTASTMLNELFKKCIGDIIFMSADDIIMRTPKWDTIVIEEMEQHKDKIVLLYGDDGYNPNFGTHFFLHRTISNIIGYISPPYFEANYIDTWWNEIFDNIDRKIKIPIYTEHMHYATGKRDADQTMIEKDRRLSTHYVFSKWYYTLEQRRMDAKKLLDYINQYNKTNDQLKYKRIYSY